MVLDKDLSPSSRKKELLSRASTEELISFRELYTQDVRDIGEVLSERDTFRESLAEVRQTPDPGKEAELKETISLFEKNAKVIIDFLRIFAHSFSLTVFSRFA